MILVRRFTVVAFPKKICSVCSQEFELRPEKPGFANRCPACSEDETGTKNPTEKTDRDQTDARRKAMRDLLYRKDS
jgi:hypothetical protein